MKKEELKQAADIFKKFKEIKKSENIEDKEAIAQAIAEVKSKE
jgi:hypothetical protein